jgi:hypothetical protein
LDSLRVPQDGSGVPTAGIASEPFDIALLFVTVPPELPDVSAQVLPITLDFTCVAIDSTEVLRIGGCRNRDCSNDGHETER